MSIHYSFTPTTKFTFQENFNYNRTQDLKCSACLYDTFGNAIGHLETLQDLLSDEDAGSQENQIKYVLEPAFGPKHAQQRDEVVERLQTLLKNATDLILDTRIKVVGVRGSVPNGSVLCHTNGKALAYARPADQSMGFLDDFYSQDELFRDFIMIHELTHIFLETEDAFYIVNEKEELIRTISGYEHAEMSELRRLPNCIIRNADSYAVAAIRVSWLKKYGPNYSGFDMTVSNAIKTYHKKEPDGGGSDIGSRLESYQSMYHELHTGT